MKPDLDWITRWNHTKPGRKHYALAAWGLLLRLARWAAAGWIALDLWHRFGGKQ